MPQRFRPICRFETPEHQAAGDQLQLKTLTSSGEVETISAYAKLPIGNNELSYGDILALAGDYFASKEPIATATTDNQAQERFLAGFNTLAASSKETTDKLFYINQHAYVQNTALNSYIQQLMLVMTLGKNYFDITNNNLDHFYSWSVKAYTVGHQVAMGMAQKGYEQRQLGNWDQANRYLMLAYQMNAAACHYLSDSFSSGHLREQTLRQQLSKQFGVLGGVLVNNMHNEDNQLGVNVTNQCGDSWTAYGDDNYSKPADNVNRTIQYKALQQSANEIFSAYQTGIKPQQSGVNQYLPSVTNGPNSNFDHPQYAPMFKMSDSGKILYRNPINELNPEKVTYKELGWLTSLMLTVQLRVFSSSNKPVFTASSTQKQTVKPTTGKLLSSLECDPEKALQERVNLATTPKPVNQAPLPSTVLPQEDFATTYQSTPALR